MCINTKSGRFHAGTIAEFDTLTGIYNKAKFFEATRRMLNEGRQERFAFIHLNIRHSSYKADCNVNGIR